MGKFLRDVLIRWFISVLEITVLFPVILIIFNVLTPDLGLLFFFLTLNIAYFIGILFGKLSDFTYRNLILLLGLSAFIFALYFVLEFTLDFVLFSVLYCAIYFRGFKSAEYSYFKNLPAQLFFVSYLLHLAVIFYVSRVFELHHFLPYLAWSAILTVVISLFAMNFIQLVFSTLPEESLPRLPKGVLKKNFTMVAVILGVIFAATYSGHIREMFLLLWRSFTATMSMLYTFLSSLLLADSEGMSPALIDRMIPSVIEESIRHANPLFQLIIDIISTFLIALILLICFYLLLRSVYYLLRAIFIAMFRYAKNFSLISNTSDYGIIDQKESLLDISKLKENFRSKIESLIDSFLKREKKWHELSDNIEKVKFLYRLNIIKYVNAGFTYKKHLSPDEMADEAERMRYDKSSQFREIAALYSAARYGNKDPGESKISEIKDKIMD